MNPRFDAIATIGKRAQRFRGEELQASEYFGKHVFNRKVMQKMLPSKVYKNVLDALEGRAKILPEYADAIAEAMKNWALSLGATHFTHWFQPLTGAAAEKHDAFITWSGEDQVIEKFSGRQLIQGEPDASSFPSGGLRSTFEARGYTGWDPTSPAFIWKAGDGITLCIPSVFFSWTGAVLDHKIPLLRSQERLNQVVLRLLRLTGVKASRVLPTIGLEQEYFVVDRALRDLRPDLLAVGRTVYGAPPPKGQELQDHYLGSVKDRILNFLRAFEIEALKLGIPVKTRHNEVAPAQHEVAPVFETASIAIDHNILMMELMRQVANQHHLACLLHEKPFGELNGSGKHCNWSLVTDTGINLLDPTDTPENTTHFLFLLAAILQGVHTHADLLRASISSAGNDHRLGGHEAPPAIMSVYLGEALEQFLDDIEQKGAHVSKGIASPYDLGYLSLPHLSRDNTDRNRTSPFAFTGNKFEMRALGSSANPSFLVSVLNLIVADSLEKMLNRVETEGIIPVVQEVLRSSKGVRFSGDNYSEAWMAEAKKRKLPHITKSVYAFDALLNDRVFEGVLTKEELKSRFETHLEAYAKTLNIEAKLMLEMFHSQVLPVSLEQQKRMAKSIVATSAVLEGDLSYQKGALQSLSVALTQALSLAQKLEEKRLFALEQKESGKAFCDEVVPLMERLRERVDTLEMVVDDALWPLPKYRELLFIF